MNRQPGLTRRSALAWGAAAATAGCGFRPLYAPGGAQDAALAQIYVDIIPNRSGQQMRQALQQRLGSGGDAPAAKFVLSASFSIGSEGLSVQPDNSTTRTRSIGTSAWSLKQAAPPGRRITSGSVRSVDGYNIIDEQFFYADLTLEAVTERLANALADQIAQRVAAYFRQHPNTA